MLSQLLLRLLGTAVACRARLLNCPCVCWRNFRGESSMWALLLGGPGMPSLLPLLLISLLALGA